MTPSQVLDRVRYLCKLSTGDGSGAESDLVPLLNDYYLRQVVDFLNTNEEKFGKKAKTTLNVLPNIEKYKVPQDFLRIKRAEITYDGSTWRILRPMDDSEQTEDSLTATNINNDYATSFPYYELFGDSLYLRPIPTTNVSLGLRIWYYGRPTLITNISVDVIQTPQDYHGYLAYGVSSEVATRQGNDALAASMFQKWEDGRRKIEQTFAPRVLNKQVDFKLNPVDYT